jgi:hypothetical protein
VEPVLGLVEDDGGGRLEDFIGDFQGVYVVFGGE